MNLKISYLFLFTLLISSITFGQKFESPLDYLEFISSEQEVITNNMWTYTKAIAHSKNEKNVDTKLNSLLKSIERAIAKIEKADSYEDDEYKEQVLKNIRLNENLLKQDYDKIIDMKAVAEQSYDQMEAYLLAREMADEKMAEVQQEYEDHFMAFAKKHNIEILENKSDLSRKMKISGEVFDHYNEVYLIFFKVNINELYLWEAIEKNDVSAIQQNANALEQATQEGKERLKSVTLYKEDNSLVEATMSMFDYFTDETENKIPQIISFLILNDEVTSINESIENTPERKRTKKQIDGYNAKVKEINKAVKNYNKITTEQNKTRNAVIGKINTANEKFLARHIPND
ncbi:hypothetical protein [Ulvibacter antarcticus]|uniref:Uncharacterized protein n=1 Tax=Ulvibacter antarcticus TaxID=442714 RepID=A0A3L9YTX5_9FLAO|nr:hypothetical protein [Ulvibacter antarcticus]RMA64201.1 hypothetical protein BXY75_1071 [Ulvibacter antarcticus]